MRGSADVHFSPVKRGHIDLGDSSQVIEILRLASAELERAEIRAEHAEARAEAAEQEMGRTAEHSAATIADLQHRLVVQECQSGEQVRQLTTRLVRAERAADVARNEAKSGIRSAKLLASEAEQRAETTAEQAKIVVQRLLWMREALVQANEQVNGTPRAQPEPASTVCDLVLADRKGLPERQGRAHPGPETVAAPALGTVKARQRTPDSAAA